MKIGLAIFVKTPGLSPVKTRLAANIGKDQAEEFYRRSIKSTIAFSKKLEKHVVGLKVHWAIAEEDGLNHAFWNDFQNVSQGGGSLGERLSFVYNELLKKFDQVYFIGADSPHLDYLEMANLMNSHKENNFILGETSDGGFYLFGGHFPIPKELWMSVEYSQFSTCKDLSEKLSLISEIDYLPQGFDIDEVEDFKKYIDPNIELKNQLPEQIETINWIKENFLIQN
jgi:hypothetical protein